MSTEASSFPIPKSARVAVLVAHPDDETLWCGGVLLMNPEWSTFIATICRASDADRSQKFFKVVEQLRADGAMADLDDGPEQEPLECVTVCSTLRSLVAERKFDLVVSHAPGGEYTRHRRHEEVSDAVLTMWRAGEFGAARLWLFAFRDQGRGTLPRAIANADLCLDLPDEIWSEKARLMQTVYGFETQSWEARTTPRSEAFWTVRDAGDDLERLGA